MWAMGGGASEIDIGDNVQNSMVLDPVASQYLNRSFIAGGNQKTWTMNIEFKRGKIGVAQNLYGTVLSLFSGNAYNLTTCTFTASDTLEFFIHNAGTTYCWLVTNKLFRDPAKTYNLTIIFDSTQVTASDRVKIYVDSERLTSFSTASYPAFDTTYYVNQNGLVETIGVYPHVIGGGGYYDGYLSRFILVDGQALDPSYFGRTSVDTGAWVNKTYTGTYGANGFILEFKNGANLGTDTSGNGNNWTLNGGITSANQTTDTPTNNYCVLNPITPYIAAGFAIYRGNTKFQTNTTNTGTAFGAFFIRSGTWYWEVYADSVGAGALGIGIATEVTRVNPGFDTGSALYCSVNGQKYLSGVASAYGATWATGVTIGIEYNADTGTIEFFRNDVSQGTWVISGYAGIPVTPCISDGSSLAFLSTANFGATPLTYPTRASGAKPLCTANLPTPSIIRPAKYFKAKTRTGTGAAANITGIEFSPDLVWTKSRSAATSHVLANSVVGSTKYLSSDSTAAEVTDAQSVTAFNADGFSVGTAAILNTNLATYIDWMWDKSVVSGVDIITYTGNLAANRQITHSLGITPKMSIVKARTAATVQNGWPVSLFNLASGYELLLNSIIGQTLATTRGYLGLTNSSYVTCVNGSTDNAEVNENGVLYELYLFADVEGFSKFGSYTGNGSTDGPFIYCGFRPAFILYKRVDSTGDWRIFDDARNLYNQTDLILQPDANAAEVAEAIDILSNGFKLRNTTVGANASGGGYIFAAFASQSIKYSNAR